MATVQMTDYLEAAQLVRVESANLDRYRRNFLRQAVCEFRFPTLLELGRSRPPEQFVKALRKDYPILELVHEMQLGFGGEPLEPVNKHVLRTEKRKWSVSIKENAFSIETSAYTEYPELRERTLGALKAAAKVIDSDFFTRVGLRYINVVEGDASEDPVQSGWVNQELVAPLLAGNFLGVGEYSGRLALASEDGGCLLQHGLQFKPRQDPFEVTEIIPGYTVDIDVFRNGVRLIDAEETLDRMHEQAFNVFDWTLGEPARDYLSKPRSA